MSTDPTEFVLVVDDEEENLDLIQRTCFGRWNMHTCLRPRDAVKFAKEHNLAVVISDFRMPEMNGDVFLNTIHKVDPSVGCVLVTAFGDLPEVKELVKRKRVSQLLVKPWDVDEFIRSVEQAIKITKMRRSVDSMVGSMD